MHFTKKKITVFGGDQLRPNLNIKDYCSVVNLLINSKSKNIKNQIFNVGYENMSINELAKLVQKIYMNKYCKKVEIIKTTSDDIRSYHINSDKIFQVLNFKPQFSIDDAIISLFDAFEKGNLGDTFDNDIYFNVKRMQNLKIK